MEIRETDPNRYNYICALCGYSRGLHSAKNLSCPDFGKRNTFLKNQTFLFSDIHRYEEEINKMLVKAHIFYAGRY
jgi:hypothetical protein